MENLNPKTTKVESETKTKFSIEENSDARKIFEVKISSVYQAGVISFYLPRRCLEFTSIGPEMVYYEVHVGSTTMKTLDTLIKKTAFATGQQI